MTVLVTGGDGQLGRALAALDRPGRAITALGRDRLDVTDAAAVTRAIERLAPTAVINAAAMTDVDGAEREPASAFAVNRDGAAYVAEACRRLGLPLLHVSTDHVFDGRGDGPIGEDAPTGPVNAYGRSKLAGEEAVRRAHPDGSVILRTSWVFSARGRNFVRSILQAAQTRDWLSVVDDQHGRPTPADDLAAACLAVLERRRDDGVPAVLHFGGEPPVTRHAFAAAIVALAGGHTVVEAVASAAVPRAAARPANAVLDGARYVAATGRPLPLWRDGLARVLERLLATDGTEA